MAKQTKISGDEQAEQLVGWWVKLYRSPPNGYSVATKNRTRAA